MVELDPELSAKARLFRDAIEFPETGSVWRVVSAEAPLKEGLNPTFTLFDEVHVQPDDSLWNVFRLAMGARREPLLVGITTAGVKTDTHGQPSLCYRMYEMGVEVARGRVKNPTFFFAWWAAPERADYRSVPVWKGANPGYNDIVSAADFHSSVQPGATRENEFRTKRLNQWVSDDEAWLPFGTWDAISDPNRLVPDGEPIVVGFDGAWSNDSTGLVGCTIAPPHHLFVLDAWERMDFTDPDWHIDPDDVEASIRRICRKYTVRALAFDPARWQDFFARLERERFPVVEWPTNSVSRMVPACTEFEGAVLQGAAEPDKRRLTHSGDARLARHIENARLKTDSRGSRIIKESKTSSRKIDLAVCAVIAFDTVLRLEPKRQSIYETRGFFVLGESPNPTDQPSA